MTKEKTEAGSREREIKEGAKLLPLLRGRPGVY